LNQRNRIAGDFSYDLARNVNDIAEMMKALANPRRYENDEYLSSPTGVPSLPDPLAPLSGPIGDLVRNFAVPEIIGDFNGDGNFDAQDIRYFADGLAIDPGTGRLNRRMGWNAVDAGWLAWKGTAYQIAGGRPEYAGAQPPWQPSLPCYMPLWPDARVQGAAVADIAGNTASPGGEPTGQDGIVDCRDIDYVYKNFGDFRNLRYDAVRMDLSADMNGDLVVNQADVDIVVLEVLCTHYGDANLDGVVDATDQLIVTGHMGMPGGWCEGDFNGDGMVTAADQAILNPNMNQRSACHCVSDVNCDHAANGLDLQAFVNALLGSPYSTSCSPCNKLLADSNNDGVLNHADIAGFIANILAKCQ